MHEKLTELFHRQPEHARSRPDRAYQVLTDAVALPWYDHDEIMIALAREMPELSEDPVNGMTSLVRYGERRIGCRGIVSLILDRRDPSWSHPIGLAQNAAALRRFRGASEEERNLVFLMTRLLRATQQT
jgi:hypothetical protein